MCEFKLKVVSCSVPGYWYANRIGETFLSSGMDSRGEYRVESETGWLDASDVILINDTHTTLTAKIQSKIDGLKLDQAAFSTSSEKAHAAWNLEIASSFRQQAHNCKDMISVLESLLVD